jgi:hypothetical protein
MNAFMAVKSGDSALFSISLALIYRGYKPQAEQGRTTGVGANFRCTEKT